MSGDNKKQQAAAQGQVGHGPKKASSGVTDAQRASLLKEVETICGKVAMMPDFAKRKIREACDVWLNRDRLGQAPPLNSTKDLEGNVPPAPRRQSPTPKKVKWQKTALGARLKVTKHIDRKQNPDRTSEEADAWGNVGGAVGAALVRAKKIHLDDDTITSEVDKLELAEGVEPAQRFVREVGKLFQPEGHTEMSEDDRKARRDQAKAEKAQKKAEKAAAAGSMPAGAPS